MATMAGNAAAGMVEAWERWRTVPEAVHNGKLPPYWRWVMLSILVYSSTISVLTGQVLPPWPRTLPRPAVPTTARAHPSSPHQGFSSIAVDASEYYGVSETVINSLVTASNTAQILVVRRRRACSLVSFAPRADAVRAGFLFHHEHGVAVRPTAALHCGLLPPRCWWLAGLLRRRPLSLGPGLGVCRRAAV